MRKIVLFLIGCALVLGAFAFVWPVVLHPYARFQALCVQFLLSSHLHATVDGEGIAVYRDERLITRREFLSFGGLGLTLALWLMTPSFSWKRRTLWTALGLVVLFFWHMLSLRGLVAFSEALEAHRAGGLMTLLYSVIALGDWIVPVIVWGAVVIYYRFWGSGAAP
ncbi:MAG: hypothetical protein RMJ29_07105 [Candidatus Bipolaricaulota bacterium]|nr:hypothetical protein [Candidatus Bipolaricaulota bacterium]